MMGVQTTQPYRERLRWERAWALKSCSDEASAACAATRQGQDPVVVGERGIVLAVYHLWRVI